MDADLFVHHSSLAEAGRGHLRRRSAEEGQRPSRGQRSLEPRHGRAVEPRRGFGNSPHSQGGRCGKEGEAGDGGRGLGGAQSPGDGETDAVGPGPGAMKHQAGSAVRTRAPTPPARSAALDKACTVLGDGVGRGCRHGEEGRWSCGGDTGCRVGVRGW